jgi:phosphoribosylanthranilate isomerase
VGLFETSGIGVKICGITRPVDADACVRAGADALGFNFFSESKRYVDPATALEWIRALEGVVERVAVVVNPSSELLQKLKESGCFEMIQFHGDESPEVCAASGVGSWIKALRVKRGDSLAMPGLYSTTNLLIDAWSPREYGGTGVQTDHGMARELVEAFPTKRFALAGGLMPDNVAKAILEVHPAAVDVAGGVESSPGVKDAGKVEAFLQAVRNAQG